MSDYLYLHVDPTSKVDLTIYDGEYLTYSVQSDADGPCAQGGTWFFKGDPVAILKEDYPETRFSVKDLRSNGNDKGLVAGQGIKIHESSSGATFSVDPDSLADMIEEKPAIVEPLMKAIAGNEAFIAALANSAVFMTQFVEALSKAQATIGSFAMPTLEQFVEEVNSDPDADQFPVEAPPTADKEEDSTDRWDEIE